jgi:hypothetical protein
MKTYPRPTRKFESFEDIANDFELRAKVVFEIQRSVGLHTIPELAKRLNESEDEIAKALYSLCLVSMPRVLILDNGEPYFRKAVELANTDELPEFTSETQFYHINWR